MKKKFTAFLLAFNIFSYTTICCYVTPVFALPVISSEVLFNGLMTLLFTLGVSLDLTNLTKETANDYIQNKIENGIDSSSNVSLLQEQYNDFLNGIDNGYCKIGIEFYQFLQDLFYNDCVKNDYMKLSLPVKVSNALYSTVNYPCYVLYIANGNGRISTYKRSLIQIIKPTTTNYNLSVGFFLSVNKSSSNYDEYEWATATGYRTGLDKVSLHFNNNLDYYSDGTTDANYWDFYTDKGVVPEYTYFGYQTFQSSGYMTSLIPAESSGAYDLVLDGVWVDTDGDITTVDGTYPQVLDGDKVSDIADDIITGVTDWPDAITQEISDYPENPAIPDKGLTLTQLDNLISSLDLNRLETKFPFCIPNDLMLIMNGATAVSSNNAPVIEIPMRLEFNDTVFYENDKAIIIDFNDFSDVVTIFREGFFLLFLIALLWVSIDILQAFFVVTE